MSNRQIARTVIALSPLILFRIYIGTFSSSFKPLIIPQSNAKSRTYDSTINFADVDIISFKGEGTVSVAFNVLIPTLDDQKYILKVTGDKHLHYSTTEIEMFQVLNAPPTNPSIPKLVLGVKALRKYQPLLTHLLTRTHSLSFSAANPFATWNMKQLMDLGLSQNSAKWLHKFKEISLQVFPCIPHTHFPSSKEIPELARFVHSLLTALNFAHSRNIMNCDLYFNNIFYDGKTGTTYE
jgi:hypothetical protein